MFINSGCAIMASQWDWRHSFCSSTLVQRLDLQCTAWRIVTLNHSNMLLTLLSPAIAVQLTYSQVEKYFKSHISKAVNFSETTRRLI